VDLRQRAAQRLAASSKLSGTELDALTMTYVGEASRRLDIYRREVEAWARDPAARLRPRSRKPTHRSLALALLPERSETAALKVLRLARDPERMRRLGLEDPLD
jgi:hypothetical protein